MIHNIGDPTMTLIKSIFSAKKFGLSILGGISAYLAPISTTIICVLSFIIVDVIFGYLVSRKYGYKNIESYKLWKTINKLFEAVALIIGAYALDTHIVTSIDLHAVEIMSGMICGTELLSWLESMKELHPNCLFVRVLDKVLGNLIKAKGEKYLGIDIDIDELRKYKKYDNTNNLSS